MLVCHGWLGLRFAMCGRPSISFYLLCLVVSKAIHAIRHLSNGVWFVSGGVKEGNGLAFGGVWQGHAPSQAEHNTASFSVR